MAKKPKHTLGQELVEWPFNADFDKPTKEEVEQVKIWLAHTEVHYGGGYGRLPTKRMKVSSWVAEHDKSREDLRSPVQIGALSTWGRKKK